VRERLSKNLEELEAGLTEFVHKNGRRGVGYATSLGDIDILAEDHGGDLVVVKIDDNDDPVTALGVLLGQTAWVREHLANGGEVRGILVSQAISEGLDYAVSEIPSICICRYELHVNVRHRKPPHVPSSVRAPEQPTAEASVCVVS